MEKVISVALAEEGYLEKKTNDMLESKTGNAGSNNYTKFGRDMGCNGQPWCDAFVDWCFKKAYGAVEAKKLLGGWSNYTPTSAQYFKNMKQWHTTNPQRGDVIFFKNSQRICHTGIVLEVKGGRVYTIEGNTSGGSTLEANGGCVAKKNYPLNYNRIAGYGRPAYGGVVTTPAASDNKYYPACSKSSTSIVTALAALGEDSSKANRAKIAAKNGIDNYVGSAEQNIKMLNLLKQGKLLK